MHPHPVADGQRRRRHQLAATGRVRRVRPHRAAGASPHRDCAALPAGVPAPRACAERKRRTWSANPEPRAERPPDRKVATELATKVTAMPSAIGRSPPRRGVPRTVPGAAERTGSDKDDHRNAQHPAPVQQAEHVGRESPGAATPVGVAYIITCIMQKEATKSRHSDKRDSLRGQCDGLRPGVGKRPVADRSAPPRSSRRPGCAADPQTTTARCAAPLTSARLPPSTFSSASSIWPAQTYKFMPPISRRDCPARRPGRRRSTG